MASTGLLQAFDQGLSKALQGYTAERDRKDKRAIDERRLLTEEADREEKRTQLAEKLLYEKQKDMAGLLKDGFSPVAAGATPKSGLITTQLGDQTLAYDPTAKKLWNPNPLEKIQYEKAAQELKLAQEKDTPEGKYAALPTETKGKVGNIVNALTQLTKLEDAVSRGVNPSYFNSNTPLIGMAISDDDYTAAQRGLNEEYARLQSGASTTKQEDAKFKALDPLPADTPEQKMKKLAGKREMLENKFVAFGVDKKNLSKLGFDPGKMGLIKEEQGPGLLAGESAAPKNTLAGPGAVSLPKASAEDAAALQWANANPKDPRAAAIKARLGAK